MSDFLIESISPESLKQINTMIERLNEGVESVVKMNKEFKNINIPSQVSQGFSKIDTEVKKTKRSISDYAKQQQKLANSEKARMQSTSSLNRQIIRNREETKRVNKELRTEERLVNKSVGAYAKLRIKLAQAEKEYLDLGTTQKASNAEMRRAQREVLKLRNLSDKLNTGIRRGYDDVGRYGKIWKKTGGILRASIGVFGLYQGIQFAKSVFQDIKAIDGLNKALAQVTETTENFSKAKTFVANVAEEAGVEILGLTKSYTKFLAAAKTTNLTGAQTENIFRQVAKAGSVLGLSTDDINGSFRALEQILSKGKVQAEEIRGQLGERLPGAFQILAESMGLSTAELSKQLELGNVLSEEVLPKFAAQLEKTYGLDQVDRVETLTAAQNRLGNSWTSFVESVENGSGIISKALISIFGGVSDLLEGFKLLNLSADEYADKLKNDIAGESAKEAMKGIRQEAEATGQSVQAVAEIYANANQERLDQLKQQEKGLRSNKERLEEFLITETRASNPGLYKDRSEQIEELEDRIRDNIKTQGVYNGIVDAANSLIEKGNDSLENQNEWLIKTILSKSKEYTIDQLSIKSKEELLAILANINKKRGDGNTKIEKQITLIDKLIKQEKDLAKATKERFKSGLSEGQDEVSANSLLEGLVTAEDGELLDTLNQKLAETAEEMERVKKVQRDIASEDILFDAFNRLESQLGVQAGTFEALFDGIRLGFDDVGEAADNFGNLATGIFSNITQASNVRLENERRNLEIEKATAIEFAGDSAADREEIERRYDERQKAIQAKQAKNEKAQALFEIGISTAVGVIKALAMTPPNIPLSIAIGALGLAQAAVVASTPVPAFKDGVRGFKGGTAMINDQKGSNYQEIVRTPDGKMRKYSGRNLLLDLPKGSDVLSATETKAFENDLNGILGGNGINPLGSAIHTKAIAPIIMKMESGGISEDQMRKIMQESIAKQSKTTTVFDKKGVSNYVQNGHSKKQILNNRVTFEGLKV